MKRRRMATGHTSAIQAWSTTILIFSESHELYMAVYAIERQISQRLVQPDRMNWDQVMDHFSKGM